VKGELSRDTSGPTADVVTALLEHAGSQARPQLRTRNLALLRLLFDLGLRVAEVTHLDVADYDAKQGGLWVKGKGRTRKERLQLPAPTRLALQNWLTIRGRAPGQLLKSFSKNSAKDGRLCTRGVYRIVRNLGADIGIHLHPHMLRHSAITEAVNRSVALGLSLDQVRDFSRHKNINTLLIYRDKQTNMQPTLAAVVAASAQKEKP
jgi:integrase/recombinase XerC